MNKTVTANISGIVFHIEQQAYEKLHKYLTTIRNYFHDSDGKDEIMADIESRIAELFRESLNNGKEVITMSEVDRVVEIMGEPEQYMDEGEEFQQSHSDHSYSYNQSNEEKFRSKKLFRDEDDKVLGGVCSGFGHYFGIDRIWLRAAFLIALIFFGSGVLLYIILWAIIPKAKTTAEKLEMKGEPINVENIGNTIKEEFNTFKKKVDNVDSKGQVRKAENAIHKFFDLIGKLLIFAFKFIVKLLGVVFIAASSIALITLLTILIGAPTDIDFNGENFGSYWNEGLAEIFFSSESMFYSGYIGGFLIILIPLLVLLYAGLKIVFDIPSSNKLVGITAFALFIIGAVMISISASSTASEYTTRQNITEMIPIENFPSDTLILSSLDDSYSSRSFHSHEIYIENDYILTDNLEIDVIQSKTENIYLRLNKSSRGGNRKEAGSRAEKIDFTYELEENELKVSQYIDFPLEDKFRNQEVKISIALPVGKSIYLSSSSTDIIYDIKNVTNTYDGKMIGHTWLMTEDGLSCTDCKWIVDKTDNEDSDEEENI